MKRKTSPENVYEFIKKHLQQHGYAPSIREISAGTGLSGPRAQIELARLEGQGRIAMTPGIARSIRVLKP
jgi:SOS-response transcriptional repressor LexA